MSDQRRMRGILGAAFFWAVTSACSPRPPAEHAETENAHSFAVEHHAELERELTGGSGPHVRTLVSLAKCPNVINAARALTEQKASIYPAPDAEVAADRIVAVLSSNAELGCTAANDGAINSDPAALQRRDEGRAKNVADRANMKEQYGE